MTPQTARHKKAAIMPAFTTFKSLFFYIKKKREDKSTEKLLSVFPPIPRACAASLLGSPLSSKKKKVTKLNLL